MFGDVKQKSEYTIRKKRNWKQEQSVDISLVIQQSQKGYMFYCPTHSTRIVESGNARFIENGETSGSDTSQNVAIKEV